MNTPFKAVIFDCDGTLVDSEPLGIEALLAEAAIHGFSMNPVDALDAFKGIKMAECVHFIEEDLGHSLPDDFVPNVRQRSEVLFLRELKEMPGARDLLSSIRLPHCIASNGPPEKILLNLRATRLDEVYRGHILSAYQVGHWKPAPQLFLAAADQLGVEPTACAVVEDSHAGISAGLAAGMTVFALNPSVAELAAFSSDKLFKLRKLRDLPRMIRLAQAPH